MPQQRTGGNVAKKVLMENENGFRSLLQESVDAQLLLDGEVCIDCNDAARKMMGCTRKEELLGYHVNDHSPLIQPGGRPSLDKAEGRRFEWVYRRADGTDFPAEVTLTPISFNGKPLVHAAVREITERNRSQRALRKSELWYEDLAELLPQTLFEMDMTGKITLSIIGAWSTLAIRERSLKRVSRSLRSSPPKTVQGPLIIPAASFKARNRRVQSMLQ